LLSLRYKWTLLLSVLSALLIAFVWGASISTVYPVVEVVFEGETIRTWLDEAIAAADAEAGRLRKEIEGLRVQQEKADPEQRGPLAARIALRQGRLQTQEKKREYYVSLRPAVEKWAPHTPFGTLVLVIALLLAATLVKGACLVLQVVLVARIAAATVLDMRRMFFREVLRMDQSRIDKIGTNRLMTMFSHNVNLVQAGLTGIYGKSIREPLKILACLLVACMISWPLLLLSLLIAPFAAYLIHYLAQRMKHAAGREIQGFAAVFQTLLETLGGIKLIKIFTRQRKERRRFKGNARSLYKMAVRIAFYDSLIRPITELTGIITIAVAILGGAYLVLNQETHLFGLRMSARPLTAAEMFTFFAMLAGIADPARKLSDIYNSLVRAAMGSKTLYTTFETSPRIAAPAAPKRAPRHKKSIRFENVTFGYDPRVPVLHQINLEIPFRQTLALVGPNGSGKSTFANLIARFYDPQAGTVFLDDVDVRHIRPFQLHKQIGMVTQDPMLFRETIWANICYSNPTATKRQVLRAAELAGVTDFVHELPQEFKTQVGDRGSALSGGQRQRVALARAILSNPRILILDEATSQVDGQTEAALHHSLKEFLRARTTILVTHRRSTLALADRAVVMEAGRIVEDVPAAALTRDVVSFPAPVRHAV